MLDRLNQEINTDRAVVPVPEEELFSFDPKKDITPGEWEEIYNCLEKEQDLSSFARLFFNFKILDPNLSIKKSNIDWEGGIRKCIESKPQELSRLAQIVFYYKSLYGQDLFETDNFNTNMKNWVVNKLWDWQYHNEWWGFTHLSSILKIIGSKINPYHRSVKGKDKILKATKEDLEKTYYNNGFLKESIELAAYLKILEPKIDPGIEISDSQFEEMKNRLQNYRKMKIWWEYAELASVLAILSARDIVFDPCGIHLVFEKEKGFQEQMPDRPRVF